ncbi:hypothetical protein [Secundilactobacillus folii]|uniref:Uncharacterized protein n=1 Tax=Secundilactobacillus folii TaxID=2678357 RepID=A0A7X3C2C0_9LACO|nr:hypothetical protein [Secundilactobacillus folii]MTV81657.1 hypothetical protein [Secundilactobacillus folii]
MLAEDYQKRPLPDELAGIKINSQLADRLNHSYAWVEVKNERPFTSLISPVGTDEAALYRFIDNATINHHDLNRFLNHPVTADDVQAVFQTPEPQPVAEQYLGSFLLQQSQQNDLFLPLMNVLSLANYDVIGVFAAMLSPNSDSIVETLIEMSARLLSRLAPKMITLDHLPEETDYILPAHLLIAIEDSDGEPADIPVALLDWLPNHLSAIKDLADNDQIGLLNYLNSQDDDDSQVVREWLMRNEENQNDFSNWIFQHRHQVK